MGSKQRTKQRTALGAVVPNGGTIIVLDGQTLCHIPGLHKRKYLGERAKGYDPVGAHVTLDKTFLI